MSSNEDSSDEVTNVEQVRIDDGVNRARKPRKLVCIADGSVCTPVKHSGFFSWFNFCFSIGSKKELSMFVNSLPQQLYEKIDEDDNVVKMYLSGCGTNGGLQSYYEVTTGWEIPHLVIKILTFLGSNYREGSDDEVILFGYSRGGYAMSLVTQFLQFFSRHNEGRCVPTGLRVWNDVTPKKLVYDLTHWREEELLKTFSKSQLENDFKLLPLSQIRSLGLMDVVPMYSNQSILCEPCCGCIPYLFWTRSMRLPAGRTFRGIEKVVHVVPNNIVDIYCPGSLCPGYSSKGWCPWFNWFELFPTAIIKKEDGEEDETIGNVEQYFLEGEDHLRMSDNVDLVDIVNSEMKRCGLKLKQELVSKNKNSKRDCCYFFYFINPLYIGWKKKEPKDDWIVTRLERDDSGSGSDDDSEGEEESEELDEESEQENLLKKNEEEDESSSSGSD